jgi:hypothetical protein
MMCLHVCNLRTPSFVPCYYCHIFAKMCVIFLLSFECVSIFRLNIPNQGSLSSQECVQKLNSLPTQPFCLDSSNNGRCKMFLDFFICVCVFCNYHLSYCIISAFLFSFTKKSYMDVQLFFPWWIHNLWINSTKVKVFFQGLHVTLGIHMLVYQLIFAILHIKLTIMFKILTKQFTPWQYIMYTMHLCFVSHKNE